MNKPEQQNNEKDLNRGPDPDLGKWSIVDCYPGHTCVYIRRKNSDQKTDQTDTG